MKPKYSSVSFDTIAPLNPFDSTAAKVVSKGESFEVNITDEVCSPTPLPIQRLTSERLRQPQFKDLTGKTIGRFTVMGLSEKGLNNGQGACWVVRCVCGNYERKKSSVLRRQLRKKDNLENMRCAECRYKVRVEQGLGKGMKQKIDVVTLEEKNKQRGTND